MAAVYLGILALDVLMAVALVGGTLVAWRLTDGQAVRAQAEGSRAARRQAA